MIDQSSYDYSGKVAFVTGAANGIGRATGLAFARNGASVVLVDINEKIDEVRREVEAAGGKALAVKADISRSTDVQEALRRTIEVFGGIDFAFNNAGVEQSKTPLGDLEEDEFERLVAINIGGVYHCMKYQIPLMLARGSGSIVNTSSGAGIVGISGQAAYAATKHAVIGLSKSAALEYIEKNVRINIVCPGVIETPMIMDRVSGGTKEGQAAMIAQEPIGRLGKPEEIAAAVLYMCSDAAAFLVGHALVVDGGQTTGI